MSERLQFIERLLAGERMSDLCREFGISRQTGYKFRERFEREQLAGLETGRELCDGSPIEPTRPSASCW